MRVLLKAVLDCEPDAAWRAVRSPAVMREVAWPFLGFSSLDGEFPERWTPGPHPVAVNALGLVPVGEQVIDISYRRRGDADIQIDSGRGLSGTLELVTAWEHSIAISPASGGGTLYRDRLVVGVGPATLAAWPAYWTFWQWRLARLRRLAPTWA
jgi:hypothetical protein